MSNPISREARKKEEDKSYKEESKKGNEFIPGVDQRSGIEKFPFEGNNLISGVQKESSKDQESYPEGSERAPREEMYINPKINDPYHEQILGLLKIVNNKTLNSIYYRVVPQIKKNSLLALDLSYPPSVVSIRLMQ